MLFNLPSACCCFRFPQVQLSTGQVATVTQVDPVDGFILDLNPELAGVEWCGGGLFGIMWGWMLPGRWRPLLRWSLLTASCSTPSWQVWNGVGMVCVNSVTTATQMDPVGDGFILDLNPELTGVEWCGGGLFGTVWRPSLRWTLSTASSLT